MKTLVVLASSILLTFSGQFASAKSQDKQLPVTGYYQSVQEKPTGKLSKFRCTVTVDGIVVMKGAAEGFSAEDVEKKLAKQYTEIFREGEYIPEVKVSCNLVEKKK